MRRKVQNAEHIIHGASGLVSLVLTILKVFLDHKSNIKMHLKLTLSTFCTVKTLKKFHNFAFRISYLWITQFIIQYDLTTINVHSGI